MSTSFWRSLTRGTRFQVLFYGGCALIGILFFVAPQIVRSDTWQPVLVGLGIAFVSSSVLGLVHRAFFYDDFRAEMGRW